MNSRTSVVNWWFVLILLLLTFSVSALATDPFVSPPAGFIHLELASNSFVLVSMPFEPFRGKLADLFSNQLTGESSEESADRLVKWDASTQQYRAFFKGDGTGFPEKDGNWFKAGTDWPPVDETVFAGEGFWIGNRHDVQDIFLSGYVVMADPQATEFSEGLNLFGTPYLSKGLLGDTGLAAVDGDRILDAMGREWAFLNGQWVNSAGEPADIAITPGLGFWYERLSAEKMVWTPERPYADVFQARAKVLRIRGMQFDPVRQTVTLDILCSGIPGEMLEIMAKDLGVDDDFVSETGWSVAQENLVTAGRTSLAWTDSRIMTGVYCRVYLVGRQDIDSDGDGFSDVNEIFVRQSDPVNAGNGEKKAERSGSAQDQNAKWVSERLSGSRESEARLLDGVAAGNTYYVNEVTGNDSYDGVDTLARNGHGPLKTVRSALGKAKAGDTVVLAAGVYAENLKSISAPNVTFETSAGVVLY